MTQRYHLISHDHTERNIGNFFFDWLTGHTVKTRTALPPQTYAVNWGEWVVYVNKPHSDVVGFPDTFNVYVAKKKHRPRSSVNKTVKVFINQSSLVNSFLIARRTPQAFFVRGRMTDWMKVGSVPRNWRSLLDPIHAAHSHAVNATSNFYPDHVPCYSLSNRATEATGNFHQANVLAYDEAFVFIIRKLKKAKKHTAFWLNMGETLQKEARQYEVATQKSIELIERREFIAAKFKHLVT